MLNIGAESARWAGLQIDLLAKYRAGHITADHLDWFNNLSKETRDKLAGVNTPLTPLVDNRFELITSFEVTVPTSYVHATQLDSFRATHQSEKNKEFYYYNPALTDANFAKTPVLAPGKKFLVKAFQIKGVVTSDDCLAQLRRVKATLTGAQGASLAYEQAKDKLPISRWSLSFDEKDNLPFVGGCHGVPSVRRGSGGGFGFRLDVFEGGWDGGCVLLAFCDLPAGEA
jgi:hypothetical protein